MSKRTNLEVERETERWRWKRQLVAEDCERLVAD